MKPDVIAEHNDSMGWADNLIPFSTKFVLLTTKNN